MLDRCYPDRRIPAPGTDIVGWLGLGEEILEINVTPDRGYCFSMRGVAREYSHSTGAAFRDPGLPGVIAAEPPSATPDGFPVVFADDAPVRGQKGVDRFVARVVRGVDPAAPTPRWMVERLEAAGMRSLSLAVDITNYVMLDLGQPMHAYDLGDLAAPIVVRRARDGESLVTLDSEERALDPEDLLITDSPDGEGSRVIGIAGVMGGQYSEVGPATTDVLLEAAHFDPVSVARSARRHRLHSEASKRFERGADPRLPAVAAQRAAELLARYGGGAIDSAVTDVDEAPAPAPIAFPVGEAERLTGVAHTVERVVELLETVGCSVDGPADGVMTVVPPSWRSDLVDAAGLVEEIARLDGYDNIPVVMPPASAPAAAPPLRWRRRAWSRSSPTPSCRTPSTARGWRPTTRAAPPCGCATRWPTTRPCCAPPCSTRCSTSPGAMWRAPTRTWPSTSWEWSHGPRGRSRHPCPPPSAAPTRRPSPPSTRAPPPSRGTSRAS